MNPRKVWFLTVFTGNVRVCVSSTAFVSLAESFCLLLCSSIQRGGKTALAKPSKTLQISLDIKWLECWPLGILVCLTPGMLISGRNSVSKHWWKNIERGRFFWVWKHCIFQQKRKLHGEKWKVIILGVSLMPLTSLSEWLCRRACVCVLKLRGVCQRLSFTASGVERVDALQQKYNYSLVLIGRGCEPEWDSREQAGEEEGNFLKVPIYKRAFIQKREQGSGGVIHWIS